MKRSILAGILACMAIISVAYAQNGTIVKQPKVVDPFKQEEQEDTSSGMLKPSSQRKVRYVSGFSTDGNAKKRKQLESDPQLEAAIDKLEAKLAELDNSTVQDKPKTEERKTFISEQESKDEKFPKVDF